MPNLDWVMKHGEVNEQQTSHTLWRLLMLQCKA